MSSLPNLFHITKIYSLTSRLLIFYKRYLYSSSEKPPHVFPVFLKSSSPHIREAEPRIRPLIHKGLLHLYITSLLQLRHMTTQITKRKAHLVHKIPEISHLQHVKVSHDEKPGRLMDEPVDLIQRGKAIVAMQSRQRYNPL